MPGYSGYHTSNKRSWSVTATLVVIAAHIVFVGVLYQLTQTEYIRDLIKISKLITVQEPVKPKEPEPPPPEEMTPEPEARPEPPPEPPPPVREVPPEPVPEEEVVAEPRGPSPDTAVQDSRPVETAPFAIGKGRGRFSGYEDLLTASIQAVYQQPVDLPDGLDYAVLCQLMLDEDGYVLGYKLMNSSGSEAFDRSTQQALSRLRQVRPPPAGMSRTIIVKFFPP